MTHCGIRPGSGAAPERPAAAFEAPLRILLQDEHLVAIDKPAGLLVHRTGLDPGATRFALQMLRDQIGRRVWPAHRLDRGTSGVLLFATSEAAAREIGVAFETRAVRKRYLALVRGWPAPEGTIDHPLAKLEEDAPRGEAGDGAGQPRPAITAWRRVARLEIAARVDRYPTARYALLELEPHTGRRHQIRRHLKHVSHPIVGDSTWGKGRHNRFVAGLAGVDRMWLHALELVVPHPAGGEIAIAAEPGPEWARLRALGEWADG